MSFIKNFIKRESKMKVDIQELKARMVYNKHFQRDIAKAVGISSKTFGLKLKKGDFKISEIHKLMKAVPLTMQDVEKIFFSE